MIIRLSVFNQAMKRLIEFAAKMIFLASVIICIFSMIVKKCKIINRVAKYVRIRPNDLHCMYCQRYVKGKYYCISTYYGGDYVNIICKKANSKLQDFSYIPELWYVINKAL